MVGDQVSSCPVLVIWVHMIRTNPGNAWVCPGLQAPMHTGLYISCLGSHATFELLSYVYSYTKYVTICNSQIVHGPAVSIAWVGRGFGIIDYITGASYNGSIYAAESRLSVILIAADIDCSRHFMVLYLGKIPFISM